MRESFEYFYPVDLRISGKDLLPNHLAMYIFNHCAIFPDPKNWPISINCNGWILVDGEKMSKSAGNFITIESATFNSSIDSLRMALADAGDDLDDANYVSSTGKDTNVLRLFTFVESIQRFIASKSQSSDNDDDTSNCSMELDKVFIERLRVISMGVIKAYENYRYRDVLREAFFGVNALKEKYRTYVKYTKNNLNPTVMTLLIKQQLSWLFPIIPHIAEYCWKLMDIPYSLCIVPIDKGMSTSIDVDDMIQSYDIFEEFMGDIRERVEKIRRKAKNKVLTKITIYNAPVQNHNQKLILEAQFIKFLIEYQKTSDSKFNVLMT